MASLISLCLGVLALCPTIAQAASRASSASEYNLYAYGGNLGGISMLYYDGYAYLANTAPNSSFTSVYFTEDTSAPTNWTVHSNTTASPNATFNEGIMALPTTGSSSRQIAFVSSDNVTSDETSAKYVLNGGTVMVEEGTTLETLFYATETDTSEVYSLLWNVADPNDATVTAVTLRTVNPAN